MPSDKNISPGIKSGNLFFLAAAVVCTVTAVSLIILAEYQRYHHHLLNRFLILSAAITTVIALALAGLAYHFFRKKRKTFENETAEKQRIELALRESEQRLFDIINFLPDATFAVDLEHRVIIWNRAMEELTGVRAQNMLGRGDYEYAIPFYGERRPVLIDYCLDPYRSRQTEIFGRYPEITLDKSRLTAEAMVPGTVRKGAHIWAIAQPLHDAQGKIIGAIESMRDVTDRKLSEEKYATIFRLSPFVLSISSLSDGKYLEVSDRFYELTGYTKDEVIGRTAFDLNIWADPNDRERIVKELQAAGRVVNDEIKFRSKSGEIKVMFFSAEIVVIAGSPCLLAVNVDITDRKMEQEIIRRQNEELVASNEEFEALNEELVSSQNELMTTNQKLMQSEEKVATAFNLAPVILTLSRVSDGRYVEVSDYFLKTTEYTRDEVIGHTSLELNIWANLDDRRRVLEKLGRGTPVRDEEIMFQSKTGVQYLMLFSAEIINIFDVPHLISTAIDITEHRRAQEEKRRLEQQLIQAQKMESIGRLAGGVAHDFNNLLTAIIGNIDMALESIGNPGETASRLEVVKKAATSASQLTRQLLAFSRKETIEPVVMDLNETIERTRMMLSRLISENISLKTIYKATGCIKADTGQIEQIIINLVVNSRDAMPDGGTLVIRTEDAVLDEHYCKIHTSMVPGEYVMMSITDTGYGMSDETKKNLFEPFYTTKGRGKGTGLGLAMVYGAVKQNNGDIEVYSVVNEGTTIKIYFPRAERPGTETRAVNEKERALGGDETVLIVEDDDMVRDFAAQVLSHLGYRVMQTSNGEDAIRFTESYEKNINLLITDVILPGMNGKTLARKMMSLKPGIKVLFTSGYTEDIIAERGIIEEGINFIGKPYAAASLAGKIRDMLDR